MGYFGNLDNNISNKFKIIWNIYKYILQLINQIGWVNLEKIIGLWIRSNFKSSNVSFSKSQDNLDLIESERFDSLNFKINGVW
jgi:hypothetical protein